MNVVIVGLGYIGLPTAVVMSDAGHTVVGVDVKPDVIAEINAGRPHIVEPGLADLLARVVESGALEARLEPCPADAFVIAVPTPFKGDHEPDLAYVEAAAKAVAPHLQDGSLVVLESTSPVGATEQLASWLAAERPDLTFPDAATDVAGSVSIAYCPERVLPGQILEELRSNDRILGGVSSSCSQAALELYESFVRGHCHLTTARTAELVKLSENAFRDVNIAFANELSVIAGHHEIDAREVIGLANRHPRVNILSPGPGVGGHCIAVDPWFIVHGSPEHSRLIAQARQVNDDKPQWVLDKVAAAAADFDRPTIACFGLAYKPDIDDLRNSPALDVASALAADDGYDVIVVEPNLDALPGTLADAATLVTLDDALEQADVVVALVGHTPFKSIAASDLASSIVIDTVGLWD